MPNPTTNAENLPAIPLTEDQRYVFDTRGWLLVPGVLSESEIQEMRSVLLPTQTGTGSPFPNTTAIPSAVP